jgi:hypothetical protein
MRTNGHGRVPIKLYLTHPQPKLGVTAHASNPSIQEAEMGELWVRGQPGLQSEYEANLGCTERPCLKTKQNKTKQNKTPPKTQQLRWARGLKTLGVDFAAGPARIELSSSMEAEFFQLVGPVINF